MTQDLIAKFISERGVTRCPPVLAKGAEASSVLRAHVAEKRRQFKKDSPPQGETKLPASS